MARKLYRLVLFVSLLIPLAPAFATSPAPVAVVVDDEYDSYKKKGDDFFKAGRYAEARRQYQNCLEVPGFENDPYANGQLNKCAIALILRQQTDDALKQNKGLEAVALFDKLLAINAEDAITRTQLADYYEREGNRLFNQKRYLEARTSYKQALTYAVETKQETLSIQIRNIDAILYPKPSRRIGLKLLTGAVAVGAGAYALLLRSDFQTKLATLNQVSQTVDPSNTGVIAPPGDYRQWDEAYTKAEAARKKNGLYKTLIGVAAVATVAELYLLIRKPKPRTRALNWHPASESWGLAATLTF